MNATFTPGCIVFPCRNDGVYLLSLECRCPGRRTVIRVCVEHAAKTRKNGAQMGCCGEGRVTEAVSAA